LLISFTDITERKRAAAAQEQSESLFRALFELSPDAIVLIDPNDPNVSWPVFDCNLAACTMSGYSRDELVGHSIDILNVTTGTQEERNDYMRQLCESGTLEYETEHRRKNGDVFPVEVSTSMIKVGERELVIGIDRDITDRKRAEGELMESKAIVDAVVENIPLMLFLKEATDLRFIMFNRAGEELLGYDRKALLGKKNLDLFPPNKQPTSWPKTGKCLMEKPAY